MEFYDVFNGDADGICALVQLRHAYPRAAKLVTGVKRDIRLLERIVPVAGDEIVALDISLDVNRAALLRALDAGAHITWFDHHFAGEVPRQPGLISHIDPHPAMCTSLIVDRQLQGRFRAWAVVAAFGDNLDASARRAAGSLELSGQDLTLLRELGLCINYNAYGETVDDLHFPPRELYLQLAAFPNPLSFIRDSRIFAQLKLAMHDDLAKAESQSVELVGSGAAVVLLPDERWSRRAVGVYANVLAARRPSRAHAVLVRKSGGYMVSMRAPIANPTGAVGVARAFTSGGGREGAAGIDLLPESDLERFLAALREAYPG